MEVEEFFCLNPRGYSWVEVRQRPLTYHRRSKYTPHQGKAECARRKSR